MPSGTKVTVRDHVGDWYWAEGSRDTDAGYYAGWVNTGLLAHCRMTEASE